MSKLSWGIASLLCLSAVLFGQTTSLSGTVADPSGDVIPGATVSNRQTLAAILEPLRHEFSLSDTQLGGLFTLFTVVFALAGVPLGKLADTRSRRGPLALGAAVWTGPTGLAGLATSYALLLGARLGNNVGTLPVPSTSRAFRQLAPIRPITVAKAT